MTSAAPEPSTPPQALSPGRAVLWFFATPGILLLLFLFYWPYPPLWLVDLIAFGPLAVGGAALAIAKLAGKPLRPVATVVVPACMISAGYTIAGVTDVQVLDWTPLLLTSLALGVLAALPVVRLLAPAAMMTPLQKFVAAASMGGLAAAYAYGTGGLVNYQADIAPTQHFTAEVVRRSSFDARRSYRYVTLGPWGPERRSVRYDVVHEAHDRLRTGGIACVDLHKGLLGLRWVEVGPCAPFVRPRGRR